MSPSTGRVREVGREDFAELCRELARRVQSYQPDLVVGILTGGAYVARLVVDDISPLPTYGEVRLQRPATKAKERIPLGAILNHLPDPLLWRLRMLEVDARERLLRRDRGTSALAGNDDSLVELLRSLALNPQRVLVVDDTVDSGRTLLRVQGAAERAFPGADIRTAVLTSTWRRPPVYPDYCLHERILMRFFWSFDAST